MRPRNRGPPVEVPGKAAELSKSGFRAEACGESWEAAAKPLKARPPFRTNSRLVPYLFRMFSVLFRRPKEQCSSTRAFPFSAAPVQQNGTSHSVPVVDRDGDTLQFGRKPAQLRACLDLNMPTRVRLVRQKAHSGRRWCCRHSPHKRMEVPNQIRSRWDSSRQGWAEPHPMP